MQVSSRICIDWSMFLDENVEGSYWAPKLLPFANIDMLSPHLSGGMERSSVSPTKGRPRSKPPAQQNLYNTLAAVPMTIDNLANNPSYYGAFPVWNSPYSAPAEFPDIFYSPEIDPNGQSRKRKMQIGQYFSRANADEEHSDLISGMSKKQLLDAAKFFREKALTAGYQNYHKLQQKPAKMAVRSTLPDKAVPVQKRVVPLELVRYITSTTGQVVKVARNKDENEAAKADFMRKFKSIDFENVTVSQLKDFLRDYSLNCAGKKAMLSRRVKDFARLVMGAIQPLNENCQKKEDHDSLDLTLNELLCDKRDFASEDGSKSSEPFGLLSLEQLLPTFPADLSGQEEVVEIPPELDLVEFNK